MITKLRLPTIHLYYTYKTMPMNALSYFIILWFVLISPLPALSQNTTMASEPPANEPEQAQNAIGNDSETPASQTTTSKALEPAPLPTEQAQMALLAASVDEASVQWLQTGEEKFLSLFEQDNTGTPQGAILMLHAEGQHPNWPLTLKTMRTNLPDYGWITLAIALPAPDQSPMPERVYSDPAITISEAKSEPGEEENASGDSSNDPKAESNKLAQEEPSASNKEPSASSEDNPKAGEKESEEAFDSESGEVASTKTLNTTPTPAPTTDPPKSPPIQAEKISHQRLQAALDFLHKQGQFNIVLLGDGIGAARAGAFFRDLSPPGSAPKGSNKIIKPIRAMVIINARNQIPQSPINLPDSLYDPEIPILDIYFDTDLRDEKESRRRKRYAARQNFKVYQQIRLPELAGLPHARDNRLSRRVRGFLQKYARGVKVDANLP